MRKLKGLLLLTALLCLGHVQAKATGLFEEEQVAVKFTTASVVNVSTHVILIDLSSTTVFPHKFTGAINIYSIRVALDKIATSSGSIKIGVVTACDVSVGTVTYFAEGSYDRSAAGTEIVLNPMWNQGVIRAKVDENGNTPYILSNDKLLSSTAFQTDVTMHSPAGTASFPGKGDIVATLTNAGAVATDFTVEVIYNSERP